MVYGIWCKIPDIWEFAKKTGPFLGVPIRRLIASWGLFWDPLIYATPSHGNSGCLLRKSELQGLCEPWSELLI